MDAGKIGKTFLKIAAWIVGFVIVPILTALGLSTVLKWQFDTIIFWFAIFYVAVFLIAFCFHALRDLIKKIVTEVIEEQKNKKGGTK